MSSNDFPQLDVLYEDNHLLVVNKPALLPTMGVKPTEDSLYRQAAAYLKQKYNKPGNVFVGIVSRLDAHVSGAIVLARTSKAASRLSDQIRRGTVDKRYLALIPSGLQPATGRIIDRLYKNESRHRMEAIPDHAATVPGEKQASLSYDTIDQTTSQQLLKIQLETGRKHQIRIQLKNAGHPIIGDRKYASQQSFPRGIALHCYHLSFLHPTKKQLQSVQAGPPTYWNADRFEKLPLFLRSENEKRN
jgi:23S rRNA pseudouridine1911/1915/1917 synthase